MNVVVAVIVNAEKKILITQRSSKQLYSGYWEFPGGKIENQETPWQALVREVKEEVNLDVQSGIYLGNVLYQFKDKSLNLKIYYINQYRGEAVCCESQMGLSWIKYENLNSYQFPEANQLIIDLLEEKIIANGFHHRDILLQEADHSV